MGFNKLAIKNMIDIPELLINRHNETGYIKNYPGKKAGVVCSSVTKMAFETVTAGCSRVF